jgi:alpha-ribazole phosphatase/probable phosphoglycerate mutase
VSSPLARCRAFAEELASRHGLALELEPRFMELGFGEWEGRTAEELRARDAEILLRFWQDPLNHSPPGAEPLVAFRDRVLAAWEHWLTRAAGEHLLVVTHAGVIRMILCHALDMPYERLFRIEVPNAGLTRLRVEQNGTIVLPRLVFHAGRL